MSKIKTYPFSKEGLKMAVNEQPLYMNIDLLPLVCVTLSGKLIAVISLLALSA